MESTHMTIRHPNGRCTGSASSWKLVPAHGAVPGHIDVAFARQKPTPEFSPVPQFDWESASTFSLSVGEIGEVLAVFRGCQESIADGKGLWHCGEGYSRTFKMSHRIEPCPGYLLTICERRSGAKDDEAWFKLQPNEAIFVCGAIENSLGLLAFGSAPYFVGQENS